MKTLTHKHHIIPKHAGGTDDASNLIEVSPAMHAWLHKMRYETYGDKWDYIAWKGLEGTFGKEELIKEAQLEGIRKWRSTPEAKLRDAKLIGNQNAKGSTHTKSEEAKRRISKAMTGRTLSEETKLKISKNSTSKKAVITPEGEFESVIAAAEHYGISYNTAKARCQKKRLGWSYK